MIWERDRYHIQKHRVCTDVLKIRLSAIFQGFQLRNIFWFAEVNRKPGNAP